MTMARMTANAAAALLGLTPEVVQQGLREEGISGFGALTRADLERLLVSRAVDDGYHRLPRERYLTLGMVARSLRVDPAALGALLLEHQVPLFDGLHPTLVHALTRRVKQGDDGVLTLRGGVALATVQSEGIRDQERAAQRRAAQVMRLQGAPATDIPATHHDPTWGNKPFALFTTSARWGKTQLLPFREKLITVLPAHPRLKVELPLRCGEALSDSVLFWMPHQSVLSIGFSGRLDVAELMPRDMLAGLVAFESPLPLTEEADWIPQQVPPHDAVAFRAVQWFIEGDFVHVIGWQLANRHHIDAPEIQATVQLASGSRIAPRTGSLQQQWPAWPWVPSVRARFPMTAAFDLVRVRRASDQACLAALRQTWLDVAAARRAHAPSDDSQAPSPSTSQQRPDTPDPREDPSAPRYVQLTRNDGSRASTLAPEPHDQRRYHVSWSVRGHMRNQRYGPGLSQVRTIYIAPHERGPHSAPHLGPKVFLLPAPEES